MLCQIVLMGAPQVQCGMSAITTIGSRSRPTDLPRRSWTAISTPKPINVKLNALHSVEHALRPRPQIWLSNTNAMGIARIRTARSLPSGASPKRPRRKTGQIIRSKATAPNATPMIQTSHWYWNYMFSR